MSGDLSNGEGVEVPRPSQVGNLERKPAHRLRKSSGGAGSPYRGIFMLCLEM